MDIKKLQVDHKVWEIKNYPLSPSTEVLLGLHKQLGILSHAELDITRNEHFDRWPIVEDERRATADLFIWLLHFCNSKGWDLEELLKEYEDLCLDR